MNDPGLDDPIAEDSEDVDVEHQKKDEKDEKEEDKQAFLKPRVSRVSAVFDMSVKTSFNATPPFHAPFP